MKRRILFYGLWPHIKSVWPPVRTLVFQDPTKPLYRAYVVIKAKRSAQPAPVTMQTCEYQRDYLILKITELKPEISRTKEPKHICIPI